MTNRVHIDAPAGVIDIEGEKDFVEGLLAKLFPLIEEVGFGSRPQGQSNSQDTEDDSPVILDEGNAEEAVKQKIKRRRGSLPPKGQSCGDRLLALKADGFFKEHRGGGDIIAGLKAKGWTHKSNQVAAAAGKLFDRGQLQRTKEGNGPFKYFWDRDLEPDSKRAQ
ncbi:hypothetical protein [Neorhizobium petrolearium]|uniref:Nuclease n=1 Tax=Neorhizobium petrolearium TaxID=515361 RepID=A0ABY8M4Z7_9HYPH|nr:hypothetical protein [Neorhizobium petrolearium]MCC2608444.1 hypothetical protein [Neorhizobium petrolearium]WGI68719.1 hypothetical protein QEO92_01055 [Neorhizobium petrolearium]